MRTRLLDPRSHASLAAALLVATTGCQHRDDTLPPGVVGSTPHDTLEKDIKPIVVPVTSPLPAAPVLRYVAGSTEKLEQLLGEIDKERRQPTLSQTFTRYRIRGTDLGNSFEHDGRVYFLFGDTVGALGGALDTMATTDATDPERGVRLDFLTLGDRYATINPPGVSMGPFEVPLAGIDIGGQAYVVVRSNHSVPEGFVRDVAVLTRYTPPATFQPLRTMSRLPTGKFITMSMHLQTGEIPGLPPGGPYVLVWGTGKYRESDAYLSIVPAASLETGDGTLYYAGTDPSGAVTWSSHESDAVPIVKDGTLGDISVTWCKDLGLWLMTYDHRRPPGIWMQYSRTPWGPWSATQQIFGAKRDHALGRFIHDSDAPTDDGLAGPVIGEGQKHPLTVHGGAYAPYVVERWTRLQGSELDLYYVMSTWNPYVVVLMKSAMQVQ